MNVSIDNLVIGAGPAGSTVAAELAQAGRETMLIEHSILKRRKTCGGGIPGRTIKILPSEAVKTFQKKIDSITIDGALFGRQIHPITANENGIPASVTVDRGEFDSALAEHARLAGANIRENCLLLSCNRTKDGFRAETTSGTVNCKHVWVADGVHSKTAKSLGFEPNRQGFCLQGYVESPTPTDTGAIFNMSIIKDGYAWAFPLENGYNVGIGGTMRSARHLDSLLAKFVATTPELSSGKLHGIKGAMIPDFTEPRERYAFAGAYLLGDAAGLVDPLTGEGIYYAVKSAKLATQAFLADSYENGYTQLLHEEIIPELKIARRLAKRYRSMPRLPKRLFLTFGKSKKYVSAFIEILCGRKKYGELPAIINR